MHSEFPPRILRKHFQGLGTTKIHTHEYISECSKSRYCHKVLRGNCYHFRKSWENHKNGGTFDVAEYRMYICAAAQGKENSMEQRRISFLTVEWAKMDGWSSMQESAGIDMYVKFVFSKKATKIDEIFTFNLTLCKGQLISKCPFGVKTSSKKPTKFFPGFLP